MLYMMKMFEINKKLYKSISELRLELRHLFGRRPEPCVIFLEWSSLLFQGKWSEVVFDCCSSFLLSLSFVCFISTYNIVY